MADSGQTVGNVHEEIAFQEWETAPGVLIEQARHGSRYVDLAGHR